MPNENLLASQEAGVVGIVDPDAYNAGFYGTDWIPMASFGRLQGIIQVGDMVATSTVDALFQQATDNAGTGKKTISGKAITQLTQAGGDDNKQAVIDLMEAEMDVNNNFDFARLYVIVGTAASDLAALVMGQSPKYGDASDNDLASVAEIIP